MAGVQRGGRGEVECEREARSLGARSRFALAFNFPPPSPPSPLYAGHAGYPGCYIIRPYTSCKPHKKQNKTTPSSRGLGRVLPCSQFPPSLSGMKRRTFLFAAFYRTTILSLWLYWRCLQVAYRLTEEIFMTSWVFLGNLNSKG